MKTNLAARAGRWSATHRRKAILGWLAFVIAAFALGSASGMQTLDDTDMAPGEAGRAERALDGAFPPSAGESILIQGAQRGARAAATAVERRLRAMPEVGEIEERQVSPDGRSILVNFSMPGDDNVDSGRIDKVLAETERAQAAHPELYIGQFGGASADKAFDDAMADDFQQAELMSVPVTLLILLVAFGSLMAAGLPVLLALSAVMATLGVVSGLSQIFPMDENVASVVLLVGLAVGVDYSLFYLRREREERAAGRDAEAALEAAAATSGRAVLISGLTVMIAMAGMYMAGSPTFTGLATGSILVVGVALIASLTVLPALLSKLGDNVERGRLPLLGRRRRGAPRNSRAWGFVLDRVLRRPAVSALAAGALLVALALPALDMEMGVPGLDSVSRDIEIMQTYDRIEAAFPGETEPARVVIQAEDVNAPAIRRAAESLDPVYADITEDGTLAVIGVRLPGNGTDAASNAGLRELREKRIPEAFGDLPGVTVNVTGTTAWTADFNALMEERMPLVFAFVLALAFALLLVTFRSVVVPIKAIVLNLLSVGAAYGVLVLVFQNEPGDTIAAWLPMFLFVILFGLSMDYHVFILSRVRELVDRGMSTERAVSEAIRSTAGVITSAAAVMVAVFAIFATLSHLEFKQMGVGLSVAILIDATIVRAVLLPATMKLLGERNWWLPRRLEWLPRVEHEGAAA
jgi:RND superfamily putative drug exporter